MGTINIRSHYPNTKLYDYITYLERINLDKERIHDLANGNGFIISSPKAIKDDLKDINGIYSSRFGQTLQDINPFANRYRCECGHTTSRFYHGLKCERCGKEVKYVDDNYECTGWIVLNDPYHVIHPNIFKSIEFLIGSKELKNILAIKNKKDQDGNEIVTVSHKDEPFAGIGMIDFYERFDEIIDYYAMKKPLKAQYAEDIRSVRDRVFTQSIPVYTSLLRPYKLEGGMFNFEGNNALYNIMAKLAATINNDELRIYRKKKPKDQLLYDLQFKFNDLYDEIVSIISGKKGNVRGCFGGRFNFTARSVIGANPKLRIDEVELSYYALVGLLQQVIINILHKTYGMKYDKAYEFLTIECMLEPNQIIIDIINALIRDSGRGIPVLINRNPTIAFGGVLQMYCVGIAEGCTMVIPLQIIEGMGADFDGDTLNIMYIINQEFLKAAELTFNPRNCCYIDMNDGYFNNSYNHQRDTLVNINALKGLSRYNYSPEQLAKIKAAQQAM